MQTAVITHVFNESVNLPIWIAHYGRNFGTANLYVFDHGSTDGSTSGLGQVNVIRVPHTPFDDVKKSDVVSHLHTVLIQHFDCVIVTDCDEVIVPDPAKYKNLATYIEIKRPIVAACIGLHVHHILTQEAPIDLDKPILSQRRVARFSGSGTKPLISSVPLRWLPGAHGSSVKPAFDSDLFVFHTKYVDYNIAMKRQIINSTNSWSEAQETSGHGGHHRFGPDRFVQEAFLEPLHNVRIGQVGPFDFENEIATMVSGMAERDGMFIFGQPAPKFVTIPERFSTCF